MMPFEFYLVFMKVRYYNNAIHEMEIQSIGGVDYEKNKENY